VFVRQGCDLQQPLPLGAGQEAEDRVGTRGLLMGLRTTLSSLGAGQLHVNLCNFSLGSCDSEMPTRTATAVVVIGLLPIWGTALFFSY